MYKQITGLDLAGYQHEITSNEVRHTVKKHAGDKERLRGQIPLTRADFDRISEITRPENIVGTDTGKRSQPLIKYEKQVNGHILTVEEVLDGRKTLRFLSMRKRPSARLDAESGPVSHVQDVRSLTSNFNIPSGAPEVNGIGNTVLDAQNNANTAPQTDNRRSFSFGKQPVYGKAVEIPVAEGKAERIYFIPKERWRDQEKAIADLGETMGAPVRFFAGNKSLRGFYDSGSGISYSNRNGNRGLEWAFWHESMHWLKGQDLALYQALLDSVMEAERITPEQLEAYRETIAQGDRLSDVEVVEEMLADEFADGAKRQAWFQQLQRQDAGLFKRFVDRFKAAMARLKSVVGAGDHSHLTLRQVEAFEGKVRMTLQSVRDAEGNRLFTDKAGFPFVKLPETAVVQYSAGETGNPEQARIDAFVDQALSHNESRRHLPLFAVGKDEVSKIYAITGIDVSGFRHVLSNHDLRHAIKQHGDAKREASRGQLPITEKDLKKIPQVLKSYDEILPGSDNVNGPSIRYVKKINDRIVVTEVVIPDRKTLLVKTMWKKPTAYIMPDKPDPQYTSTSAVIAIPPERSTKTSSK